MSLKALRLGVLGYVPGNAGGGESFCHVLSWSLLVQSAGVV
ncbi:hypothetical protein [Leptolyngbya sp. FACHB-261]|nr:hypothetical protein [Leptolyngbya sp. FACHB-261]